MSSSGLGLTDQLLADGLDVPTTATGRKGLWEYLNKPGLPADMRAQRLAEIRALQSEFGGKRIRRKSEPERQGLVLFFSPNTSSIRGRPTTDVEYKHSSYLVFVKWDNSPAQYANPHLIEVILDAK